MFSFTQQLLALRKADPALREGKLTHVPPVNEFYTYCRISGDERIVVAINNGEKQKVSLAWAKHLLGNARTLRGLLGGTVLSLSAGWEAEIEANSGEIFEAVD